MWIVIKGWINQFLRDFKKRTGYKLVLAIAAICVPIVIALYTINISPPEPNGPIPQPDINNDKQNQSARLMEWWVQNNQEFIGQRGNHDSAGFLTIWSQYFQRGRVLYNHASGWVLIIEGENKTFRKLLTPDDALITSGPGNRRIERENVERYLSVSTYSKEQKQHIWELIQKRELLGGIGTLFIRQNLYSGLGWPIGSEFLERDVILAEADGYFVFIGLKNRPGDDKTQCVMLFDESNSLFTKQTNSSI